MHHSEVQQGAYDRAAPWAPVAQVLNAALAEQRLVGAVVLVYQDGQALCRMAAGWADREARIAMAEDTVFRWASVSKPVVSAAVMRLVADGREARISVRQLLSHTAGLGYRFFEAHDQGSYAQAGVSDGMDASGIDLHNNLCRIAKVPLLYEPGTSWGYSLAVDVLGGAVHHRNVTRGRQQTLVMGIHHRHEDHTM
ncbi:beta-lactamase family protein [Comamonas piscis]|uniref:Beta-lactamase family protein n=1 Tax=Comamonas piscis TaxID=1562974 RepID=A0A7G5EHJ5_9BURK|nr:beta-lactamase family protein [Comamonas piscis]